MKKRGISAVVATILIILIVVVGVGIVWKVVLPLFAELEFLSYSDVRLNIVFQGHTVYDPNQNFAFVQIERGKDEVNVTGIEIGFNFDGTTKTYQSKKVPTPNGKYTYKFNFTNDSDMGIPQDVAPDKVTVAPIFMINNKKRLGKILDTEDMPVGRIHLSAEAWKKANEEAATAIIVTTNPNNPEGPGEPQPPVEPVFEGTTLTGCAILNESGNYRLGGDIVVDSLDDLVYGGICMFLDSSDIVLDLQGHTIESILGVRTLALASEYPFDRIHVYGGTLIGFNDSIFLSGASHSIFEDISILGNTGDIESWSGVNNSFKNLIMDVEPNVMAICHITPGGCEWSYEWGGSTIRIIHGNGITLENIDLLNCSTGMEIEEINDLKLRNVNISNCMEDLPSLVLNYLDVAEITGGQFDGIELERSDNVQFSNFFSNKMKLSINSGVEITDIVSPYFTVDRTDGDFVTDSNLCNEYFDVIDSDDLTWTNVTCDDPTYCDVSCP